jgi:hypothetical protein
MDDDPRQAAARYRLERAAGDDGAADAAAPRTERSSARAGAPTARERAAFVENAIQQAIRRGDFDDLPGAGRPIEDLGRSHDPDWWIRRKIETEQLTGLGPPALMLRVEHAEMEERLDALAREDDVRDAVADFNRRVIEARRQLLGGPAVVTPTREVEAEVDRWRARRAAREAAAAAAAQRSAETPRRRRRGRREEAGGEQARARLPRAGTSPPGEERDARGPR